MKKIAGLLALVMLLGSFTFQTSKYTNLATYIYDLIDASEITIKYFKAPQAKDYFGDVSDKDKFAMHMIYAADSGVLEFPKKNIYPHNKIKVSYARVLMDRAYKHVTGKDERISEKVFDELRKNSDFSKLKDNNYLTISAEKEAIKIYREKIKDFKEPAVNNNDGIKIITSKEPGYLTVTLSLGQKNTGGYTIKIIDGKQYEDAIEIKYITKAPKPGDMVTQAITFPQDTIKIKVDNSDRNFKISLTKVDK